VEMTLFCVWVGAEKQTVTVTPPPASKKSQQLALGMPIDCGTVYANRCAEKGEVCECMKYPNRPITKHQPKMSHLQKN